ncbi:unnamed protein product [marine sediment metagenome]|uniref:Uncharacterized protein n=1 Tax=marine sediment metagenome TaxID=412755 RepID=X1V778_9ZZZZ
MNNNNFKITIDFEPISRRIIKGEVGIKGFDDLELEEFKKDEEKIQIDAFNLIDIGKKLEREKKYDKAIAKVRKGNRIT